MVVDENFESFVSNWTRFKDQLVIFLEAGASVGAKNKRGVNLPNAYDLRNGMWKEFKADEPITFDPASLKLMSLEHASAIIEAKTGRTILSEYLTEIFTCDLPLWPHVALPHLNPRSMFTTNYDELIELGYKNSSYLPDVICSDRSPVSGRTILYKPHGSLSHSNQAVGRGGLVITQFDYLKMISEYRTMLRKAMTGFDTACVLIVGYSFGDMDIGAELYSLRKQNSGIPWYTIFPRDDPQVRKMYSKHFEIEQINGTFESFLSELDSRVDFVPLKFKHKYKDALRAEGMIQ